jgi:type VI secretion system secreted protein VgrG
MEIHLESSRFSWEGVHVRALTGREAISQLFAFDVDVVCDPEHGLPEEALPGAEVSLVFTREHEEVRRVHGMLATIRDHLDAAVDRRTYRLRLAPRAIRLGLVEMQEIHMGLSVPELIMRKLGRHGFGAEDTELRLRKTYPARELVVQYRESDLAFVGRLAEHLGISFFFEHGGGCDKLVFTDHPAGFHPVEGAEETRFHPRGEESSVFELQVTTDLVPSAYVVRDYNYRKPLLDLTAFHTVDSGNGGGVVEYGSHVRTREEAQEIAQIRAEERLSRQRVYEGKSGLPALGAGGRSTLLEHPRLEGSEDLLFIEVNHTAHQPVSGQVGGAAPGYVNTFTAVPAGLDYRPPRRTPWPRISGVVTGVIQPGPDGETGGFARLDGEGRYTVQLHFDTAPGELRSSPPIRMAQPFAGPGQSMHFPLRPGTEVIVAFADGDPDRPIIVGSVPNAASPSAVTAANADRHRITTGSGAVIEIRDRR